VTRRLVLSYLAVTAVVLLVLGVPLGLFYADREQDRATAALERDATVLATVYVSDLEAGIDLEVAAADRYARRTGARVVVVDGRGIARVDTGGTIPRDFSTRPEILIALTGNHTWGTRDSETLGTRLRYVAVPAASGGEVHGAVRLTLDTAGSAAQIRGFWVALGGVAVVVLVTVGVVGWILAGSVTRPVRRMQRAAERFASGDLRVEEGPPPGGPPELQALATTMATMAERLAAVLAEQRAFVADASHQLRTPLTALRLRLENLHAHLDGADAAAVEAAVEETDRLARLVNDLLQLARVDTRRDPLPQDLMAVAAERVDIWSAVAEAHDVVVQLAGPAAPVTALAVPGAIEQILDNLLDNAIIASPPGRAVRVSIGRAVDPGPAGASTPATAPRMCLVVADEGPGLSDDDKQRALSRFWRGSTAPGGSGLGLPIAHALAVSSGGSLDLADRPGGGLAVTVTFPAGSQAPVPAPVRSPGPVPAERSGR